MRRKLAYIVPCTAQQCLVCLVRPLKERIDGKLLMASEMASLQWWRRAFRTQWEAAAAFSSRRWQRRRGTAAILHMCTYKTLVRVPSVSYSIHVTRNITRCCYWCYSSHAYKHRGYRTSGVLLSSSFHNSTVDAVRCQVMVVVMLVRL